MELGHSLPPTGQVYTGQWSTSLASADEACLMPEVIHLMRVSTALVLRCSTENMPWIILGAMCYLSVTWIVSN